MMTIRKMIRQTGFAILLGSVLMGCKKKEEKDTDSVPSVYKKIYGATDMYVEDGYVVLKCSGLPDHNSPYYQGTSWSDKYEAYNSGSFQQNPNKIGYQNYTIKLPMNPTKAAVSEATPLGPMGISLNGVVFYNQYAGPNNQALTNEIYSFDQYGGHPDQGYRYHYHVEPTYLTATQGKNVLLGFLLDGFPVYGPKENGVTLTSNDLDAYHGHMHATEDYPAGIYHYHITADDPYINGSGYYGTPGTVSY